MYSFCTMKMLYIVLILLAIPSLACGSSEPTSSVTPCQISHQEAIALVQKELDNSVNQIPCAEGRASLRLAMADFQWETPEIWLLSSMVQNEERTVRVTYGKQGYEQLKWDVYCDSGIVAPLEDTWAVLQALITNHSKNCY